MAKDIQDTVRDVLTRALESATSQSNGHGRGVSKGSPLSGMKGLAAGAGAAALVPLAVKSAGKLARGAGMDGVGEMVRSPHEAVQGVGAKLGDRVKTRIGEKLSEKVEDAGGPGGILKSGLKEALPFTGGDDDDRGGSKVDAQGVGKGRRMPVQQSVDIGVPIEIVYNQWTQYEDWPRFMHRVTRVTQEDECNVSFAAKIWGKTKEFKAQIETQRPDARVKWRVTEGMTHTGVVTFHELGPQLTRVLLGMDVEPGGMLEKAARGMRHVKRAARADLHRFKAFVEMSEQETGAWRGVIENGEVVEEHDKSYDRKREYADLDALIKGEQETSERSTRQSRGRSASGRRSSSDSSGRSRSSASRSSGGTQTRRRRSGSNHSE